MFPDGPLLWLTLVAVQPREWLRCGLIFVLTIVVSVHVCSYIGFSGFGSRSGGSGPGPAGPGEDLMLRSAAPIRIPLRGAPAVAAGSYSRWRCVGDLETVGAVPHRACVFERVCYLPDEAGV